jgi:hypothetical protein
MLKLLNAITFLLVLNTSYSQVDSLKYLGDIEYSQGNYEETIDYYRGAGLDKLNSRQLGRLIYSEYNCNQLNEIDTSITLWINQGVMSRYIIGILKYKYKRLIPFIEDTLFTPIKLTYWNLIYGSVIAKSPIEFYSASKFMFHDQHLRFVQINSRKKVDNETFLRTDSLNMIAIIDYLNNNSPRFRKTTSDILFGVIHHYCTESFFSEKNYEFFNSKMLELIHEGLMDVSDYCYFIDKYRVFHGKLQKYGTYKEMEGLAGITSDEFEKINIERWKVGYRLKIEDQIKYNL